MSARRLLVVTTVPSTIRHFLLPYAKRMRQRGWVVDAATGDVEDGGLPPEVRAAFDSVWTIPWRRDVENPGNVLAAPRTLRRLLKEHRYDVVHTHTPVASLVTRLTVATLPRTRRPAVAYTAHGFYFNSLARPMVNRAFTGVERLAGRWTDRLLVMNAYDHEAARTHRIVPADRLLLVPGVGLDLDHYRPTPELLAQAATLRAELGIEPSRAVFSVIAELQPRKGHLVVVRALAAASGLDAVLVCAGRGSHREVILQEVERLGLTDRVIMLGSLQDVRPLVLASAATVLASRREGLSRAVLESMALGVPVLGSRIRGIADSITVPDAGILFEPGDVEGLAAAMRAVLGFPGPIELRARLEGHLTQYGVEAVVDQHEALYEELASSRPWRSTSALRRPQPSRWP